MSGYVWSFIAVFMIHEMEEVIGLPDWMKANMSMVREKYPLIAKGYSNCTQRRFSAGVYEELLLYAAVCLFSALTGNYGAWFAMLAEFAAHLVFHIICAVVVKKYIPSVITSVLMLPLCVFLMVGSVAFIDFSESGTLTALVIFALLNPVNFLLLHKLTASTSVNSFKKNKAG